MQAKSKRWMALILDAVRTFNSIYIHLDIAYVQYANANPFYVTSGLSKSTAVGGSSDRIGAIVSFSNFWCPSSS